MLGRLTLNHQPVFHVNTDGKKLTSVGNAQQLEAGGAGSSLSPAGTASSRITGTPIRTLGTTTLRDSVPRTTAASLNGQEFGLELAAVLAARVTNFKIHHDLLVSRHTARVLRLLAGLTMQFMLALPTPEMEAIGAAAAATPIPGRRDGLSLTFKLTALTAFGVNDNSWFPSEST